MKLFTQHVVRGDYWVPTNCSLTVNGGVASLIAWLDHPCQKTEVGGKQGHAPCRRILLQQIPMTMGKIRPSLLNGQHWIKTESLPVATLNGDNLSQHPLKLQFSQGNNTIPRRFNYFIKRATSSPRNELLLPSKKYLQLAGL